VGVGLVFATIALSIGGLFFLYSVRYYLILASVLIFSRRAAKKRLNQNGNGQQTIAGLYKEEESQKQSSGILYQLFHIPGETEEEAEEENRLDIDNGKNGKNGQEVILPHLEDIELKEKPFVSIHLAFYNEQKVADRILTACTHQAWPNYEVVVVDDSTDETPQILERWKDNPNVKIIHRETREGFKGGALKRALEAADPRTEYIIVFDADFVPYPDTIEQFVKHFQLAKERGIYEKLAAVQGYQWHVLNKNENWITRGVRTEFSGSYIVDRPGTEISGFMKLIAGSVYMIRADVLRKYGWMTSITEDFQLTLRLYKDGYKVLYTPYIQTPSECVSTLKRLIRQRMRWAEGHTHNVRLMFWQLIRSPNLTWREKIEFLYLTPYYLQAAFFLIGTLSWFAADFIFNAHLPFWTALWGWCLVLTNMFALPLINGVGLFLEESDQRDFVGIFSFILLSYILVPFQAYAAIKGLFEKEEGHWFRTPKTGHITDSFFRSRFRRWLTVFKPQSANLSQEYLQLVSANQSFDNFKITPRRAMWVPKAVLATLLVIAINLVIFARNVPVALATNPSTFYLSNNTSAKITSVQAFQLITSADGDDSTNTQFGSVSLSGTVNFHPGATYSTAGTPGTPTNYGWIYDTPFGDGGSIAAGTWTFYWDEQDDNSYYTCYWRVLVFKVQLSGGAIAAGSTTILDQTSTTDWCDGAGTSGNFTSVTGGATSFSANDYLYAEYWGVYSKYKAQSITVNLHTGPSHTNPRIVPPTVQIPERVLLLLAIIPFLPWLIRKRLARRKVFTMRVI
jgi:cellulose synthase/poly-beta-1,6-N-acetylglucosamine synthase-like glycosyltransferase